MKKKGSLITAIYCLLVSANVNAQITYGIQIQNFGRNGIGGVEADSISAFTTSTIQLLDYPPQGAGIFFEYHLKSRFPLILRGELNYRTGQSLNLDLLVYNNVTGMISFSNYSSLKLRSNLEIPIDINYLFIKQGVHVFKKTIDFELGLFAGVSFQFQPKASEVTYSMGQDKNTLGISDVNVAINNSIRSINYFYNYGIRAKIWNFIVTYRRDQLLTNSATNNLNVWGNSYSFKTSYNYQTISLGYTLSFKKKKESSIAEKND